MDRLLPYIRTPADLKRLSEQELEQLAGEVRERIISVVSRTGGHLASNLGVIELTVAMLAWFNPPDDRIVWDVGHQCYAYKILTGRNDRFDSLRTFGGLSGFPRRRESDCDAFDVGHAGTAVSASLGIREALRHRGQKGAVVAVIGEGSLSCGLTVEGLNNAGHLDRDLIVIFNQNNMAISPSVGALSSWFSQRLTGRTYSSLRRDVKGWLEGVPSGADLLQLIRKLIETGKVLLTPGILFEGFNFQYVGPFDGHDIPGLLRAFERASYLEGPVLLHVITEKGRGFAPASLQPHKFHGVGPFDCRNGQPLDTHAGISFSSVFGEEMVALANVRPELVAITAAMPEGTGLEAFSVVHPDRFYDVGIAESHAVTFAAGLAAEGMRPVVAIYSTFLQRAFDQIIHDVALPRLPVVLAVDRAGLVGADGETHQGSFDIAFLRLAPGMTILMPRDAAMLKLCLAHALSLDGPAALRFPRGGMPCPLDEMLPAPAGFDPGHGQLVLDLTDGASPHLALLGTGIHVYTCLRAAQKLHERGIPVRVWDAVFAKPVAPAFVERVAGNAAGLVVIEEGTGVGGYGSAVSEILSDRPVGPVPIRRLGLPDAFIHQGSQSELRRALGLSVEAVVEAGLALTVTKAAARQDPAARRRSSGRAGRSK